MDPIKQQTARVEILNFPQISRREEELLQTVLNTMSQSVPLFDSETRLIFRNKRYVEMYGLLPDVARPGRYLRDLLHHRIQTGTFTEDPDDYIARMKKCISEGETFTKSGTLDDRRAFSVVNKPITGGGWFATHEDITERQQSEDCAHGAP